MSSSLMNENDFVYYKDSEQNIYSGGFHVESMMLKQGISPIFRIPGAGAGAGAGTRLDEMEGGGGEEGNPDHMSMGSSSIYKNLVVPSFLYYQLNSGGGDPSSSESPSEETGVQRKEIYEEEDGEDGDNEDQNGGSSSGSGLSSFDLYEKLLGLMSMHPIQKSRKIMTRKNGNVQRNRLLSRSGRKTKRNQKE